MAIEGVGVGDRRGWIVALGQVFIGCCANALVLEAIIQETNDSMSLVTLAQFLFISFESFIQRVVSGKLMERTVPISQWALIVIFFFGTNVLNNLAFRFDIPMPFHIIFRSASLVVAMFLGVFYLKRSYSLVEYISVLFVTIGVLITTLATGKGFTNSSLSFENIPFSSSFFFGVLILVIALILSGFLGIYQEYVYKKYGRASDEGRFFVVRNL